MLSMLLLVTKGLNVPLVLHGIMYRYGVVEDA